MTELIVNREEVKALTGEQIREIVSLCPFGAIEENQGELKINSGCRMCGICVKKSPKGVFELRETDMGRPFVDKSKWAGIAVYIEYHEGRIHPVSLELIGKAKSLAKKAGKDFPVYALFVGRDIDKHAEELLYYGVDEVFVYNHEKLGRFLIEPYTNVFEDFIVNIKPSSILIGATAIGRSLAPRVAARMRTGLTADCTKLDIKENTDLIQIRPAFGGNIMAMIHTPNHRPQIATVRYAVFDTPERESVASGKLTFCHILDEKLESRIKIISETKKEKKNVADADVIIAAGRGVKTEKDLNMANKLAELLDAELAATRPLIESGWVAANRQIGLSGRTVKPKLMITLGVSGAVQFRAGMENSDLIISINNDNNAGIFDISHYAVKGDIYDIVPKLIEKIEGRGL